MMTGQALQTAKKSAAAKAVEYAENGMIVGLGTGSTAKFAIELIGARVAGGLDIQAVPTSMETAKLALDLSIPLLEDFTEITVTIDGADEVDRNGDLIKGGGGALTREKIVAASSKKEIIIVDDSKQVRQLGRFPLPVEVLPFGWRAVAEKLKSFGCIVDLRNTANGVFKTDNQNYILDCQFQKIMDGRTLNRQINEIPGVVETGLFVGLADLVIVGKSDGSVQEYFY